MAGALATDPRPSLIYLAPESAEADKQIEAANQADMTESQVSDIERGRNNPGWLLLIRLLVAGLDAYLSDLAAAYERVQ